MKTIIIDWDSCRLTNEDFENIIKNKIYSDYNFAIISTNKRADEIRRDLNNKVHHCAEDIANLNILIPDNEEDKLTLLEENNFLVGEDHIDDLIFVSGSAKERSVFKRSGIAAFPKLPDPPKPKLITQADNSFFTSTQKSKEKFFMQQAVKLFQSTGNTFAGNVAIVNKKNKGSESSWYAKSKSIKKMNQAQLEVFSGELLRFLLGDQQPKSRYLVDEDKIFVLSKSVNGFTNFNSQDALNKLEENHFKGLLPTLFVCMFMEEADLKADNMGIDENGRVVKIDNDAAFASILWSMIDNQVPPYTHLSQARVKQYSFSSNDIDDPINPSQFNAAVWQAGSVFRDKQITSPENIRELCYVWAKLVYSKPIIFHLIDVTIQSPELKDTLKDLITHKINMLVNMLNNHAEFINYMKEDGDRVLNQIKDEVTAYKQQNSKYFSDVNITIENENPFPMTNKIKL